MTTLLKTFTTKDPTISKELAVQNDAWVVTCSKEQMLRLFEVSNPGLEDCTVLYRAKLKTENLSGHAYLEMWCRLPGRGEFFSKGLNHMATGSNDWSSYEIPFYLKKGEQPDLLRLNVVVKATGWLWKKRVSGNLWIKEIELLRAPAQQPH